MDDSENQTPKKNSSAQQTERIVETEHITVVCPCGASFEVDAKHIGKTGRCSKCQQRIRIKTPEIDSLPSESEDDPSPKNFSHTEIKPSPSQDARKEHIKIVCECGVSFRVDSKHIGRIGRCPKCKKRIMVKPPEMYRLPDCGDDPKIYCQSDTNAEEETHNTSGQGEDTLVPRDIRKWSWGAFTLNWIWGLGNKTYVALLCFVPFVGFVMPFVLGAKGNEWAWRNKRWQSVDHFKMVQKRWSIWGLLIYGLVLLAIIVPFLLMFTIPNFADASGQTTAIKCKENQAAIESLAAITYTQNRQMDNASFPSANELPLLVNDISILSCPTGELISMIKIRARCNVT